MIIKKLSFRQVAKKIGFGSAVILFQNLKMLDEKFFNKLSFEQWMEVYKEAPDNSELKQIATAKLCVLAANFDQLYKIYNLSLLGKELKQGILVKLCEYASNFNQLILLFSFSIDIKIMSKPLEKAIGLAESFDQLYKLFSLYGNRGFDNEDCRQAILKKFKCLNTTFNQWIDLYCHFAHDSEIAQIALMKLRGLTQTVDQWYDVYCGYFRNKVVMPIAIQRLNEMDLNFDQWKKVHSKAIIDEKLTLLIMNKLSELAKTFDQWHEVWVASFGTDKIALKKAVGLATTFDQLFAIINDVYVEQQIGQIAFKKFKKLNNATFEQWLNAYRKYPNAHELNKIATDKLKRIAKTPEQWLKIYGASRSDSNLKIIAQRKMQGFIFI